MSVQRERGGGVGGAARAFCRLRTLLAVGRRAAGWRDSAIVREGARAKRGERRGSADGTCERSPPRPPFTLARSEFLVERARGSLSLSPTAAPMPPPPTIRAPPGLAIADKVQEER